MCLFNEFFSLDCDLNPICLSSKYTSANNLNLYFYEFCFFMFKWLHNSLFLLLSGYSEKYLKYCRFIFLVKVYMETLYKRDLLGINMSETLLSRPNANSLILETVGRYPHCSCLWLYLHIGTGNILSSFVNL